MINYSEKTFIKSSPVVEKGSENAKSKTKKTTKNVEEECCEKASKIKSGFQIKMEERRNKKKWKETNKSKSRGIHLANTSKLMLRNVIVRYKPA